MTDDVLDTYIRQLLESQPVGEVNIAWQGGEPTLMGVDFFRRAVALAEGQALPSGLIGSDRPFVDPGACVDVRAVRACGLRPHWTTT